MKVSAIMGIMLTVTVMTLYEWPKLKKDQKKEKGVFIAITIMGTILAIILVFFPDMPNPTDFIIWLFKPLGKYLE